MIVSKKKFLISAEFFLVLMTIIWGGTFISIKMSLSEFSPFQFLLLRFFLALVVTLFLYFPKRKELHLTSVLHGLWVGVVLLSGYFFQTLGLENTTATKSGFITGAYVIFTPILESIIIRKIPSIRILISAGIVFIGIYLISIDPHHLEVIEESINEVYWWFLSEGDFLTLIGAFCFALYIVVIDRASRLWNETSLMVGQMVSAFFITVFVYSIFNSNYDWRGFNFSYSAWWGVVYTGIIATIVPTWVQTKYQKAVTPTKAGIIFSLEPVFASFFAYLIAGEVLGWIGFLGCALIFIGILLSLEPKQ